MEDKRAKILDVAVEEFASHGYKAASTNRICEVAGVSKGLIFHYFGSKEKLYTAAVTYSVDLVMEEVSMDDMPRGNFVEGRFGRRSRNWLLVIGILLFSS
ncbi:HTH-type transcriptional repressor AcnR [Listeria booriae]|nr:HTH-type transcriptional repressor AcnR [Listeria booriae]